MIELPKCIIHYGIEGEIPLILKVSGKVTSIMGNIDVMPDLGEGCYFVQINNIPAGVSSGQVILLFEHTAKKAMERGKYEFDFSELCPIGGMDLNWRAGSRGK